MTPPLTPVLPYYITAWTHPGQHANCCGDGWRNDHTSVVSFTGAGGASVFFLSACNAATCLPVPH
eukprot:3301585-Amphidinium_carterae.1